MKTPIASLKHTGLFVTALLLMASLSWSGAAATAACSSTNYYLYTQADVDVLSATGCESILGDLYIDGILFDPSTSITNLDGLANITSVGRDLRISENLALTNLDGLTNITSVGGNLLIQQNIALTNVDGLANITSVGGFLSIYNNDALTNLDGLANLTSVGGDLGISFNNALTNLDGLANITSVGWSLEIWHNDALVNLDGLANITSVGGNLVVSENNVLTNLDGLANITSVSWGLQINENPALTNLDGLANIPSVGGDLRIFFNSALNNLDGLSNITSVRGDLSIDSNREIINLNGLANITSVESDLSIASNDALTNLDGLANITSVKNLNISNNRKLTNLNGLLNITTVGGDLRITWGALTNVDGLANITSVGGSLRVASNNALTNIDGLANLTSVGDSVFISNNAALTNLDGLASITKLDARGSITLDGNGGNLNINNNYALTNLDGLANITSIPGNLLIDGNDNATCEGVAVLLGWPNGPPDDTVGGDITIENNGAGCDSIEQILASVSYPSQPVINQATTSGNSISLAFTPSTATTTAFPITGYSASCTGSDVDVSDSPATDLLDFTPIQETLTVTGYDPTSVLSSIEVDLDVTHSDPTDLYITLTTPEGTELVLWNQGGTGGEDIVGTFPTTLIPVDSLNSVTRQTMDGDWVLSIEDIDVGPLVREGVLNSWGLRITEELARNDSGSPIEVFGAIRGRDYSCTVAPVTGLGTGPVSDAVTVNVPLELPATPTITSTDYEDGKIILTISVSDNGGADILEYGATCTDGVNTFTGTSPTPRVEVSGLTNGTAYTCTATATNTVGPSDPSVPTGSITPEELSTGLPIWLLYEATK